MIHAAQAMDVGWKGFFCSFGLASYLTLTAAGHRSGEGVSKAELAASSETPSLARRSWRVMAVALMARAISLSRLPAALAILLRVSRWKLSPGRVTHPAKMSLSRSARTVTQAALASTALAILAVSKSALRRAVTAQRALVCGRRMWPSQRRLFGLPGRSTTQHCWPTTITRERAISCKYTKVDR